MKIGNLKVAKVYTKGKIKWGIHGRPQKGLWVLTNLDNKDLVYDLQYDACAFLASLFEEHKNREVVKKVNGTV
jgi:hypothetical protein